MLDARDAGNAAGESPGVEPEQSSEVASADSAEASSERKQPRWRHALTNWTLPGAWGALIFACLSYTPSLLPRGGITQGLVAGITGAIGYGLGVLAASIWRAFANRDARTPRRWAWRTFFIAGGVLYAVMFALGQYWQSLIRDLVGVSSYNIAYAVLAPFIALLMFAALIWIGRGVRFIYRSSAALLRRWIGPRAASAVGWILAAAVTYLLISGVLLDGLVSAANEAFSLKNGTTDSGVHKPTSDLRSGGPGSVISWESLGRQGRKFTGLGPTAADIGNLTHKTAKEPIRIYAGLESADSAESRAALAVQDLERAGGFSRKNLLVVTTTGSGWVDPAMVDSLEYLSNGDSATISMQYSYLPSWISYLVDQQKAKDAGRSLFDAVYDHWSKLPADSRPHLYVAGESLGSYGAESAFSGEYDLSNRTNGVVFAGPPNFNTLFRQFSDNRDAGSPEIEPIYKDGRTVRFTNDPAVGIPPSGQSWDGTRVLYLMHASDPIDWWSPKLILNNPDWINEKPGSDVLGGMFWVPFLTFWQVTADLPFATGVPGGHGHNYTTEYVDGFNTVMKDTGFTPDQLAQLRDIVAKL
jgi:uncharacterized membrane protein